MSTDGAEIGQAIAGVLGIPATPWQVVGDAVAGYLSRAIWYLDDTPALVAEQPDFSVIAVSASASAPAVITATMPAGCPGLALWPAQQMVLHLWTQSEHKPLDVLYGVQATLQQVNASGVVLVTIGQRQQAVDPYYSGDIATNDWCETVLLWPQPQFSVDPTTRLRLVLTVLTTSTSAIVVNLGIGTGAATNVETSLVAGGSGVNLSTATPTVDGGAGSPGDPADKTSAKGTHQHPAGPVAAVTSTLYAVPDNAGNFTIMPPTGEGSSYLNVGSLTSVYPASGSFVQAAYEPNVTTFYACADGTLGTTPPSGSGFLSQTFTSVGGGGEGTGGSGATIAFGNAGYPNLVSWPGGTAPVTIYARIASLPGGYDGSPFPLTLVLFRSDASNVEDTIAEYGTLINVANLPTNGSWAALNVSVPVTAIPGGNASDILGYFVEVTSGNASAGAVLEVAYGGSQMSSITLPFPPPGADYWTGMARLPFISLANVPGLLTWNAGNVGVLVNCQMSGGIAGHVYEFKVQLLRVTGATSSVIYEGNGSFCTPGEPITSSPQVFAFAVPVQVLVGLTSDQLVLNIVGTSDVGGVPAPATVFFRVNTGGADPTQATQIQTLFVPGGGSGATGDHQLLFKRGTFLNPANAPLLGHPMSFIEPGVMHSPCGGIITTASGLFTMPDSNTAHIDGGEPLIGIATTTAGGTAWQVGDCITVWLAQARIIQGNDFSFGDSGFSGYAPIYLPLRAFVDPTNPSVGPQAQAGSGDFIDLCFSGSIWMHKSSSLG
jgi:hypothetical protein